MQFATITRILGALLMLFSLSMLPPTIIAKYYHDGGFHACALSFFITLLLGLTLWLPFRDAKNELKIRDGFFIVVLFWVVLSLFGALPFVISQHAKISFTDAFFESVSGLTTTGSEVFYGLDQLPHALLYYRQQLQFLGGMGIIVLAVAILPMLGIGGMQLYRAETPGPMKDTKLTPRIANTAKSLWFIYVGLTIACALCYWASGMNLFDAVGESFGTISTGGFSMHDNSFAYYHRAIIDIIAIVFMILGATNFGLHFMALQRGRIYHYWADLEFRAYIIILIIACAFGTGMLLLHGFYNTISDTAIHASFNIVSLATTTGFTNAAFSHWPTYLPVLIMLLALVGGCGGSTSGGVKTIRMLLLGKQTMREFRRLLHPKGVFLLKFGKKALPESAIQSMWGFISVFIVLFAILLLLLLASGLGLTSSFGALAACISNAGAGIGKVAGGFDHINTFAKWILIFAMLAGRLEIFTFLVLFTPAFWRP